MAEVPPVPHPEGSIPAAEPTPAQVAAERARGGITIDPQVLAGAAPSLEMRGITKRFPGVVANDGIDLEVRPGEIHALLGENGAGKSTLMNILYGLLTPDAGEILLDGEPIRPSPARPTPSPAASAWSTSTSCSSRSSPWPRTSSSATRRWPTRSSSTRRRPTAGSATSPHQLGFEIDPNALVGDLSVGIQQRVEILKALYRGAKILILDEPTAVLTPQETVEIFAVLRRLAAEGTSIVFISHKLYEVLEIADRITVIRRGKVVGEADPKTATEEDLAEMMVGREVSLTVEKGPATPGEVVLDVADLSVADDRGTTVVDGLASRSAPARSSGSPASPATARPSSSRRSMGLRKAASGVVEARRRRRHEPLARDLSERGVAYIPGDRQRFGLVLSYPDRRQPRPDRLPRAPYSRFGVINERAITERAGELIPEFDIRTPSGDGPDQHALRRQPAEADRRPRVQPRRSRC